MFSKALSAFVLGLVASSLVSAQTYTECDPLLKKCPDNPAAKRHVLCSLGQECSDFEVENMPSAFRKEPQGLACVISSDFQAPTLITPNYIFFGRVDVVLRSAPGRGIVTSVVLQSNDRDEIDWEWIGSDNVQVQSNYYSKGRAEPYDRGAFHKINDPVGQFHLYSIEWTPQAIVWSINKVAVRTLTYDQAQGGNAFPQTPMQVKLGTWVAGGEKSPEGTANWAGGRTDFSQAPFTAYYQSISIVNYNGKDRAGDSDTVGYKYVWSDHSGSMQSIKTVDGSAGSVKNGTRNHQENAEDGKDDSIHGESKTRDVDDKSSSETSAASSKNKFSSSSDKTEKTTVESQTTVAKTVSGSSAATASPNAVTTAVPAAACRDSSANGLVLAGACVLLSQFLL